jgi:hypothetical protein
VFQLAAAVPCALVLAARSPVAAVRALAWIAVALLAVPWESMGSRLVIAMSAAAIVTIVWTANAARPAAVRVAAACCAVAFLLLEPIAVAHVPDAVVRAAPAPRSFLATGVDPSLASTAHGVALRARPSRVEASWRTFARKTPEWAGLAVLLAAMAAAAVAAGKRRPALSTS